MVSRELTDNYDHLVIDSKVICVHVAIRSQ